MMGKDHVEIDPVLHALGPCGVFAVVQMVVFFLGYLSDAYQLFSYVFTGQDVNHRCAPPTNYSDISMLVSQDVWLNATSVHYGECTITVTHNSTTDVVITEYPCVFGMQYDRPRDTSIVSEFDLVCNRTPLAGLTQTLLSLGAGLGSLAFPALSDRYGRKRVIVITQLLMLVFSLVAGLAPNYIVFAVVKFFIGFVQQGIGLTAVTAVVELFPSTHRAVTSGFWSTLLWAICIGSLAPIAYLLRFESWRALQLSLCGAAALVIFMMALLSEPLRWLVANKKTKEAIKVVKKAAKWNRKDAQTILDVFHDLKLQESPSTGDDKQKLNGNRNEEKGANGIPVEEESHEMNQFPQSPQASPGDSQTDSSAEKLEFKQLLLNRLLRKNAIVSWFIWFVNSLTYNALYLMSSTLAGSLHLNFFLNAAVEGASCILMVPMLQKMGRKNTVGAFHIIAGVGLIASSVCFSFQGNAALHIAGTVFSLCGKLGIGGSFNTIFLYTPEIFPTNIRNTALGTSMAVSTVGGMIAPFSDVLADYAIWAPGAIFGTCSLLAVLFLRMLPESKGRELPQTLGDLEAWYTKSEATGKENNRA